MTKILQPKPPIKAQITRVFEKLSFCQARIVVNVGGAGSSKSWSSYQWLIEKLNNEKNKQFLVCRKTLPSLKLTAMKEIIDLLKEYQRYHLIEHNKTDRTLYLPDNNNWLVFTSIDDPDKIKSTKFNYILMEEGIDFTWDDFMILDTRLRNPSEDGKPNQFVINLNPSDENHWIHTRLEEGAEGLDMDVEFIYSSYKDNPFLPLDYRKTLENYKNIDPEYYKIYTEGKWATLSNRIFTGFKVTDFFPWDVEPIFGLDFGYNSPTALTRIVYNDTGRLHIKECFYETELDQETLLKRLEKSIKNKNWYIYADPEDPRLIDFIYSHGYNIHKADKNVLSGIRYMKQFNIYLEALSINLQKEFTNYKWKTDRNGRVLDEPVKSFDHLIDSARYAIYTHGSEFWHRLPVNMPTVTGARSRNSITKGF